MANHTITINENLYNEIKQYCDLNGLKPSVLCNDLLKKGITELKYGDIPFGVINKVKEGPLVSDYIVPSDKEFSPPTGDALVANMDEIFSVTPVPDKVQEQKEEKEEVKTKPKTKRTRILN